MRKELTLYNKILGGLLGGAVGDAMGAATEARTTEQIIRIFGHQVTDFEKPPADAIAAGNEPGQLTDDFSCAYFIASHIIRHRGLITQEIIKKAIMDWAGHGVFFDRFAGPTTRLALKKWQGEAPDENGGIEVLPLQATNGAAMRISPIGLLNAGNPDRAIADAVTVTLPTHDNHLAISGACAVASAVSQAVLPDADVFQVVQAGLYGAEEGERIGREVSRIAAGPSVVRRLEMAVAIGLGRGTPEEKMSEIADRVGSGLHVSEAVPAAFGLLVANGGKAMATIIGGVNIGYDTDTVATMAGAMAGAMQGAGAFPRHYPALLDQMNGIDLAYLARGIEKIARERRPAKESG